MARWSDVERFVKSNFKVMPSAPKGMMGLVFNLPDGRSQAILLSHESGDETSLDAERVQILSRIGRLSPSKVVDACRGAMATGFGGIVQLGEDTFLRHTVLIENLDENEIVIPMRMVAILADIMEQRLTGADKS